MIKPEYNEMADNDDDDCVKLNVSQMFCCYTLRCVIIDGVSYCTACAAATKGVDALARADIRFQHITLNELASKNSALFDGNNECSNCIKTLVWIGDAAECDDCLNSICALYERAIKNGDVCVVRESWV
jgi:hypothetical protein